MLLRRGHRHRRNRHGHRGARLIDHRCAAGLRVHHRIDRFARRTLAQRRQILGDRIGRRRRRGRDHGRWQRRLRLLRRRRRHLERGQIAHAREAHVDRIELRDQLGRNRLARDGDALDRLALLHLDPRLGALAEQLAQEPREPARRHDRAVARGRVLERIDDLVRRLEALLGRLRQELERDLIDLGGQPRAAHRWRRRRLRDDRVHVREVALAPIQPLRRQHLPEHDAEREQVAAAIHRGAAALLGRQVADLSLHRAGARLARAVLGLRDAEVDQLDRALVADHQVRRRHVAVNDAERAAIDADALVRVMQSRRGVSDHGEDVAERDLAAQRSRAMQERAHRLAVHVLHREEVRVAELSDVVDLRDVRVVELRGEARLFEEHLHEVRVARALAQDALQNDVPFDAGGAGTARQKDLGHATSR